MIKILDDLVGKWEKGRSPYNSHDLDGAFLADGFIFGRKDCATDLRAAIPVMEAQLDMLGQGQIELAHQLCEAQAALKRIRDSGECECDHTDENCCECVGEYCPTCIAACYARVKGA